VQAADTVTFRDHFEGTSLDPNRWTSFDNGGTLEVSKSFVALSTQPNQDQFPHFHTTQNPFPQTGDFTVKVIFQYVDSAPNGDGIVFDTEAPKNDDATRHFPWNDPALVIWQDNSHFNTTFAKIGKPSGTGPHEWKTNGVNSELHTLLFKYTNDQAAISVDGGAYSTTIPIARPTSIWVGHPAKAATKQSWNGLKIDLIEITQPTT
jgi:hypothetical protein